MKSMTYFATDTPTKAPMPTAISELIRRLRSSTRCSKKVICPPSSVSSFLTIASGGFVVMRGVLRVFVGSGALRFFGDGVGLGLSGVVGRGQAVYWVRRGLGWCRGIGPRCLVGG